MCKKEAGQRPSAIGVFRNALGKCKSEAERSESAIGVLRNALGRCKSEADRSQSAIGVLKMRPKTVAITRRPLSDIALRSPLLERQKVREGCSERLPACAGMKETVAKVR